MALSMLSRRSCAFSLAAKVIAALGWRVKPLSKSTVGASGHYAAADCTLTCPTCAACVGLWSLKEAPETQGTLGTTGLLGQWGAGAAKPRASAVRMLSIAGGLEQQPQNGASAAPASNPWLPSSSVLFGSPALTTPAVSAGPAAPRQSAGSPASVHDSGTHASAPLAGPAMSPQPSLGAGGFGSVVPFGSGAMEAPFGAKVSLASNAFLSAKPAAVTSPAVQSARASATGVSRSKTKAAAQRSDTVAASSVQQAPAAASSTAGLKRKREATPEQDQAASDAEGAERSRSKVAKILQEMFDEHLKEDVAAKLRAAGLPLGKDDTCFDPLMSHRAWCANQLLC